MGLNMAQVEAGKKWLMNNSPDLIRFPAHMDSLYKVLREKETPSGNWAGTWEHGGEGGQSDPRHLPIVMGKPPVIVTAPPSETAGRHAPIDTDATLQRMEDRCAALLDAARQVGFGTMNAHYSTKDGNADLVINISVRVRVTGTADEAA